jgi:hypothetical protein
MLYQDQRIKIKKMPNEQELSKQESLEIIHRMISNAKNNITDSGIGWLLWGSLIFLASLSTYVFIEIGYADLFLGWNIFGIISIVLLTYDFVIRKKKKPVSTYVDDLLRLFDIGFIVCLFIIIFSMNVSTSPNAGFGYLLMIYGFLMLVQGGALRFRPLMVGAAVNWIGAIAIFINKEFKYDMLISAAAVLIGYIIPGILLRMQYRRKQIIK